MKWSGLACGGIAILMLAVVLVGHFAGGSGRARGTGCTVTLEPEGSAATAPMVGVIVEANDRAYLVTPFSGLATLRSSGIERVAVASLAPEGDRGPRLFAIDDALVKADTIDRWIVGWPASKGEEAWSAVGGGSNIDLAWWPIEVPATMSSRALGEPPLDQQALMGEPANGTPISARAGTLAPQPAAIAVKAAPGSALIDPGTPWCDADGGVVALSIPFPSADERARRGAPSLSSWSDAFAVPIEPLRGLLDPGANAAKPLARVAEATRARASTAPAGERATRLQWLIAASALERFSALAPGDDRTATVPAGPATIELLPRPVDAEARVIVWPELSDLVDIDVVSADPDLRLVPVPGLHGRVLDVRDGSGLPAVLPAGRTIRASISMRLLGQAVGGPVRAMLLGREPDAGVGNRRIPGGNSLTPPTPKPPTVPAIAPPTAEPPPVSPPAPTQDPNPPEPPSTP